MEGTIFKGGLKKREAVQRNEKPKEKKSLHEVSTGNKPESWPQYAGRNIAQFPARLWETLASGAGLGGYAKELEEEYNAPEWFRQARRTALRSPEEAQEDIGGFIKQAFPESAAQYINERRPEDEKLQTVLREGLMAAGSGGLNSLSNLGRYALTSGAARAGGSAGSALLGVAGEKIGEQIGHKKLGRIAGELTGGVAGGYGGGRLASGLLPSLTLQPKVLEAEKQTAGQAVQEARRNYRKKALRTPTEKVKFNKQKMEEITKVRNEVNKFDENIKNLEKKNSELYSKAKKVESGEKGAANSISETLTESRSNLERGVTEADTLKLNKNYSDLQKKIDQNNGVLTLKDAKAFQKNFNDQIYAKTRYGEPVTNTFKNEMKSVVESLNKFIEEVGTPEHTSSWKQAEKLHRDVLDLKGTKKEFATQKNQEIRDIKAKQYSPIETKKQALRTAEAKENLTKSQQHYESIVKDIDKYPSLTNEGKAGLMAYIGHHIGGKLGVLAGWATPRLLSKIKSEFTMANNAFKNHPELYSEWKSSLRDLDKKLTPRVINDLNERSKELFKKKS